jgi:predicted choloylglycine hydrolase
MNEYGLTVGIMAVPYAAGGENPNKVTIGSLQAVRLMLDYARNVDQAISLLENYNIDFEPGPPLHYLISDSSGNSAVIEFIDGEIRVIRNSEQWQVATNFVISHSRSQDRASHCWRYGRAYHILEQAEGNISENEAMSLLDDVSQSGRVHTLWSAVYDMTTGHIQVAMGRKYAEAHEFTLEMERE